MATHDDVRRVVLSLPETSVGADGLGGSVRAGAKDKGLCWVWNERTPISRSAEPHCCCPDLQPGRAGALIAAFPDVFLTETHYTAVRRSRPALRLR